MMEEWNDGILEYCYEGIPSGYSFTVAARRYILV